MNQIGSVIQDEALQNLVPTNFNETRLESAKLIVLLSIASTVLRLLEMYSSRMKIDTLNKGSERIEGNVRNNTLQR